MFYSSAEDNIQRENNDRIIIVKAADVSLACCCDVLRTCLESVFVNREQQWRNMVEKMFFKLREQSYLKKTLKAQFLNKIFKDIVRIFKCSPPFYFNPLLPNPFGDAVPKFLF